MEIPIKLPVVGVACWFASIVRLPLLVPRVLPLLKITFLLTLRVIVPVPCVKTLELTANVIASTPGLASSFCRSTSRLAFVVKVMSPLKFTWSSPVPPLMVSEGRTSLLKAPTLIISLPLAVFTVMLCKPLRATSAGKLVVVPLFKLNFLPVTLKRMLLPFWLMSSVSPVPVTSVMMRLLPDVLMV